MATVETTNIERVLQSVKADWYLLENESGQQHVATKNGECMLLDFRVNYTFAELEKARYKLRSHPSHDLLSLQGYALESYLIHLAIYPTETAMENLARIQGFCDSLVQTNRLQQAAWILTGLDRSFRFIGNSNHQYKTFTEDDGTEWKAPHDKVILSGEDHYSFYFNRFSCVTPDVWDDLKERYIRTHYKGEHDPEIVQQELIDRNKIARKTDARLRYSDINEDIPRSYPRKQFLYRFYMNGGLIQRWSESLDKPFSDEFYSYSLHS